MESSVYVKGDIEDPYQDGFMEYLLVKQVEYPVEGYFLNYSYSTFDDTKRMLDRGLVRLYHDQNALTYISYPPVTSVYVRFKKAANPNNPSGTQEWYSSNTDYGMTAKEFWKTKKADNFRLAEAVGRDGGIVRTNVSAMNQPAVEKTFEINPDQHFLLRTVKSYVGTGAVGDSITGSLQMNDAGREYSYVPVSYESYAYEGNGLKPRYSYSFLGQETPPAEDQDVYHYLKWPEVGNLPTVESRLGKYANITSYEYNAYGDLIKEVDPKGNISTWKYKSLSTNNIRQLSQIKQISGADPSHYHQEDYLYNAQKLLDTETITDSTPTDAGANVEQTKKKLSYNSNKQITLITEESYGAETKTQKQSVKSYDSLGIKPKTIIMNVETAPGVFEDLYVTSDYDGLGRKVYQKYPDQSEASYTYDLLDRLTSETFTNQRQSRTVRYKYDDSNRRVTKTVPNVAELVTQFTPYGEIEYQGQIAWDLSGSRYLIFNTYTSDGKRLLASYPFAKEERKTEYAYNEDGSLREVREPIGTTTYQRANARKDSTGYLPMETVKTIEPNGKETIEYADRFGLMEKEFSQTGDGKQTLATTYSVDGFGQPVQQTVTDQDGAQRIWNYRYNLNGKLLQIKDPENNIYRYGYDPYGNIISVNENNTQTTKYHYNGLSWKISEESLPSGKKESFQYYPTGLLKVYQDKAGNKHEYAYTAFNDVSSITSKNPSGAIVNKETKEYDPNTSLVKSEANSNGADIADTSPDRRSISYTYDLYQRMNGFSTMNKNYTLRYTDSDDLIDELVYSDNAAVSYTYDAAGRINQVSSPLLQTVSYQYTVGNTGETETTLFPNQVQNEQHRDSFGQIDSTQQRKNGGVIWAESNRYQFGNIVTKSQNGTLFDYQYDKIDRLKAESVPTGGKSYQYDQRGNRLTVKGGTETNKGIGSYTFDARNRLQTYTNNNNETASYKYYPDGLRSTKVENYNVGACHLSPVSDKPIFSATRIEALFSGWISATKRWMPSATFPCASKESVASVANPFPQ